MSARALRLWVILASLAVLAWSAADPSALVSLAAGTLILASCALVLAVDGLRRRR